MGEEKALRIGHVGIVSEGPSSEHGIDGAVYTLTSFGYEPMLLCTWIKPSLFSSCECSICQPGLTKHRHESCSSLGAP